MQYGNVLAIIRGDSTCLVDGAISSFFYIFYHFLQKSIIFCRYALNDIIVLKIMQEFITKNIGRNLQK